MPSLLTSLQASTSELSSLDTDTETKRQLTSPASNFLTSTQNNKRFSTHYLVSLGTFSVFLACAYKISHLTSPTASI